MAHTASGNPDGGAQRMVAVQSIMATRWKLTTPACYAPDSAKSTARSFTPAILEKRGEAATFRWASGLADPCTSQEFGLNLRNAGAIEALPCNSGDAVWGGRAVARINAFAEALQCGDGGTGGCAGDCNAPSTVSEPLRSGDRHD